MKCLQIHNDYIIPGGETKSAKLIAKTLSDSGIEVITYYKDNKEISNNGFGEKCITAYKSIYNKDTVKEIREILSKNKIDFALVHNTSPLISNSVYHILKENNIPIYKYIQNYNLVCLNGALDKEDVCKECNINSYIGVKNKCYKGNYLYTMMKSRAKKLFDNKYKDTISGYIAISNFVKQKHIEFGIDASKIHVIYHFVEELKIKDLEMKKDKYFLYMGRLSKEKGIITLINAFEVLKDEKLLIMGDGELKSEFEKIVESKNINNVKFLGYKEGAEKKEILENAFANIVPSEWDEPFGRSVIESFQVGVPVIASDRGGLSELIYDKKNGFKFECGDASDLVDKINQISNLSCDEYVIMKERCLEDIRTKFCKRVYLSKFNKLVSIKDGDL